MQEVPHSQNQSAGIHMKRMSWYKMIMGFEVAWWMYSQFHCCCIMVCWYCHEMGVI